MKGLKVLLVDDNLTIIKLTEAYFSEIDELSECSIVSTSLYDVALNAMCKNRYDLYMVDYLLGRKTGLQLITEARFGGCTGAILMITHLDDPLLDKTAIECGADWFVDKMAVIPSTIVSILEMTYREWERSPYNQRLDEL